MSKFLFFSFQSQLVDVVEQANHFDVKNHNNNEQLLEIVYGLVLYVQREWCMILTLSNSPLAEPSKRATAKAQATS